MKSNFSILVAVFIIIETLICSYGWGRLMVEKAVNSSLSSTLEDVQSTCRQYEDEIGELYKLLGDN